MTVAGSLDYENATSHSITVQAASADGSLASETFSISLNDVDDTPPSAVVTSITQMVNDSGAAGDFITNDATVDVSGTFSGSLGVGESIQVSADNGANWVTATTIIGNVWVATGVSLISGDGTLITRTIDAANNVTPGASEDYTLDTAALASISLNAITEDNVVNIAESAGTVAVTGSVGGEVQDGDTVTLTVNGTTYFGAVSGGIFSVNVASSNLVADPDKVIDASVSTTDTAGNSTTATTTKAYSVDVIAPTAVTTTVVSITDDTGNPGDFITSDGSVTVQGAFSGTLGVGESIQVSANGTNWVNATAAGSIWVASSVNLVPGSGTLTTRTVDAAGNVTPGASHSYVYTTLPVFTGTPNADTLTGSNADEEFYGLAGNDVIYALGGNDYIDAGLGLDTMMGGAGNDTYYYRGAGDVIVENSGEGIDLVIAAITYTLGANVENLTLNGVDNKSGYGNNLNNVLTGNSGKNILFGYNGNDTLYGLDGNDTLDGGSNSDSLIGGNGDDSLAGQGGSDYLEGGAGNDTLNGNTEADTMVGGDGDDTYYYGGLGDVIVENSGEGTDLVFAYAPYTLGANLENLTLLGTSAISGYGNSPHNNVLTGNSAGNTLYGYNGNDTLYGLDGNDTLDGGKDDDSLFGGNGNDSLAGQSGSDYLEGGQGNDTLNGGSEPDTMVGGGGNDTYYYGGTGDVIIENSEEGMDLVIAAATYTLGANLENLTLSGTASNQGHGNSLDNILTGNNGSNQLSGYGGNDTLYGGLGNDTLTGGDSADQFVFNTALGPTNKDTIADFGHGTDLVVLENAVFAAFAATGTPNANSFDSGSGRTAADDAFDRLVYNTDNGNLYYDADGVGGAAAVQIATLTGIPTLSHDDFLIV